MPARVEEAHQHEVRHKRERPESPAPQAPARKAADTLLGPGSTRGRRHPDGVSRPRPLKAELPSVASGRQEDGMIGDPGDRQSSAPGVQKCQSSPGTIRSFGDTGPEDARERKTERDDRTETERRPATRTDRRTSSSQARHHGRGRSDPQRARDPEGRERCAVRIHREDGRETLHALRHRAQSSANWERYSAASTARPAGCRSFASRWFSSTR